MFEITKSLGATVGSANKVVAFSTAGIRL